MKVVSDFSSKLDLPESLETVESIDANHVQMAKCRSRADPQYRVISKVLKQFMRMGLQHGYETRVRSPSPVASSTERNRTAAVENTGAQPSS